MMKLDIYLIRFSCFHIYQSKICYEKRPVLTSFVNIIRKLILPLQILHKMSNSQGSLVNEHLWIYYIPSDNKENTPNAFTGVSMYIFLYILNAFQVNVFTL